MVMDMVTKIEQSPTHNASNHSLNSQSGKEHSQHFSFRGTTPSPETSSKTHPNQSSQINMTSLANSTARTPSPDISLYSRDADSHSERNPRKTTNSTKALRMDCEWTGIAEVGDVAPAPVAIVAPCTVPILAPKAVAIKPVSRTTPSPVVPPEDSTRAVTPPVLAPSKESDSVKELDYSIYDYDLDEKPGASETSLPVPVDAFRRNPSLWEDPALFDSMQESTSTRSMRSTPLLPSRPQSMKSAFTAAANSPTLSETMPSAERPVSLRDQAIAELAQCTALITQSRQAFCDKKNATLNPAANQYPTYRAVAKQWERAVATVDSVDGGMCISLVLPSMRKVKLEVCGRKKNKVRVEARRQLYHGDDVATDKDSEYICEYKLDGLATAIHPSDVSHEYTVSTGLLCVFVNRVTPQDSQLYVQKHDHTCVPYEPANGSGLSKWLPSWLRSNKGKQGPTERHNQQELRRALKESTKENTSDNMEKNESKGSTRKSFKSVAMEPPRPETNNTNADIISTKPDDTSTQSKRASSPRAPPTSAKTESSKKKRDSAKPRDPTKAAGTNEGTRTETSARAETSAPVVDRGTLLQEFINKGDVDTTVEFI